MRRNKRRKRRLEKRGGACESGRGSGDSESNSDADQPSIFGAGKGGATPPPGVNLFTTVKGADFKVGREIIGWNEKASEYLREFFDGDFERVIGTRFGDNIIKLATLIEKALTEPDKFRGVRDSQGRLQAGAIVEEGIDYLEVDNFVSAPWNVLGFQPETLKGAGTSLMEEFVKESKEFGFNGRLKLYSVERARPFYKSIGFTESEDSSGELELTPEAADRFIKSQERFKRTGSR